MQLECKIENMNSDSFCNLQIKKLRQVLFINDVRNEIQIYTALLVGSNGNREDEKNFSISQLTDKFKIDIVFDLVDDILGCKRISSENVTSDFFEEIDKIKLWGEGCKIITKQNELSKMLGNILADKQIDKEKTQISTEKYLLVCGGDNDKDIIVACEGTVNEISDMGKKGYSIFGRNLHEGVDCISWVRTTISFNGKLSAKEHITFKLLFPSADETKSMLSYISMYVCPPEGYRIIDDSEVSFFMKGKQGNKDVKNNLASVRHNEGIYYKEWIKKHHISNRYIYRLNKEKLFIGTSMPLECEAIDVSFTITPSTEKGSVQFILGAVFSAAITYGVDSGRLNQVGNCFWPVLPPDIQWYLLCTFIFFSFLRRCSRKDKIEKSKAYKFASCMYLCGFWCGISWIVYTFLFCRLKWTLVRNIYQSIPWYVAPIILTFSIIVLLGFVLMTFTKIRNYYPRKPMSKESVI